MPVIVVDVVAGDDIEMLLVEHKHVVETFPAQGANKSFTNGIRIWRTYRSEDFSNSCTSSDCGESLPKLAVVIADEESRSFTPRRGLFQLQCHPGICGMRSGRAVNDAA